MQGRAAEERRPSERLGEIETVPAGGPGVAAMLTSGTAGGACIAHFQRQLDPRADALLGFATLAHWRLLSGRSLSSTDFLPAAQACGLAALIDETVCVSALRTLAAWRRAGIAVPRVSVNVSALPGRLLCQLDSAGPVLRDTGCA